MPSMTFVATGDSFIVRRLPSTEDSSFRQVAALIRQAEVKFTNLEVTTHYFEGYPSAVSGGTWAVAQPEVLGDLKSYGFNLMNWATNHTLDYSYGGLEATKKYLEKYGIVHAGAGLNLAEAASPKYVETRSGRVALIAATSTFHECWVAGEQRRDMSGRPGINPLRYDTTYIINEERLNQLKAIAQDIDINAEHHLAVKEGFEVETDKDIFQFGNYRFKAGDPEGKVTTPQERDLKRIGAAIAEGKRQADYVIVSIHSHEMKGEDKSQPADFLVEFSRYCIDRGAHAVIGHGPHILRGIEIYKQRPIFYSLGNFIFQNDSVSHLPADFYEKYHLEHRHNVADALDARSDFNAKGLGVNRHVWESMIPMWKMENGALTEITLYPIELGYGLPRYRRGWPSLSKNICILERLKKLSEPFGTDIQLEGSVGKVC